MTTAEDSSELIANGQLSIHIPENPPSSYDGLESEPRRKSLFYDEKVPIYVTLADQASNGVAESPVSTDSASGLSINAMKSLVADVTLDEVAIAIEVKVRGSVVVDSANGVQGTTQASRTYVTYSELVTAKNLVHRESNLAVWKVVVPVEHPRTRLISPRVIVDAVVNIGRSADKSTEGGKAARHATDNHTPTSESSSSPYLNQFQPVQDINLFEALGHDIHFSHIQSNLSASKLFLADSRAAASNSATPSPGLGSSTQSFGDVSTVSEGGGARGQLMSPSSVTVATQEANEHQYQKLSKLSCELEMPVFPVINLKLRCTKAAGIQDSVIAIVEISCSESAHTAVKLTKAFIELQGGSATLLGVLSFPLILQPGESCSVSFNLYHSDVVLISKDQPTSKVKPISINVECNPLVTEPKDQEEGDKSLPVIITKWDTIIDFDMVSGHVPAPPPLKEQPAHPSHVAPGTPSVRKLMKLSRNSSSSSLPASARVNKTWQSLNGLTISFSGPSAVKVGQSFKWTVFAVNKAQATRNLSLYIQPVEKADRTLPRNTELHPVIYRSALKKMHQYAIVGSIGIVSLVNDIRIGPLYSQACYETEITMLAMTPGVHTLEGVTVFDQSTGESYDVGRLLEVVIHDN
ncbi:hypothetical protein TRVA0_002S00870 [Trichomonascus vanleenenianus]|uniref:TRAPP trafficking subunit Trs65 domain-containing protein n=1 Tax=Trichomonascus vanleenenianus TaxID=2268995 RepID=UPI003EC983E4